MTEEHRFPVAVRWVAGPGRLTNVSIPGKNDLAIAPPREFTGSCEGLWSPEDLLVSAAATCLTVTLAGFAERRGVPLLALEVRAVGHVGTRDDGRFGFRAVELEVEVETEEGSEEAIERAAELAERHCLVARALAVPVHVLVHVRTAPAPVLVAA